MPLLFSPRRTGFAETCSVKRSVGVDGQYAAPTVILTNIPCSGVWDTSRSEDDTMVSVSRQLKIFIMKPEGNTIEDEDVITTSGESYQVTMALARPKRQNVHYYECHLEARNL